MAGGNSLLVRITKSQYEELNLPSSSFARRSNAPAPDPGDRSEHQDGNWGQEIDPTQGLEICLYCCRLQYCVRRQCDAVAWSLKAAHKGRRNRSPATPKKR